MIPTQRRTRNRSAEQAHGTAERWPSVIVLAAALVATTTLSNPARAASADAPAGDHPARATPSPRERAGIAGRLSTASGRPMAGVVVLVQSLGRPVPIPDMANSTDQDGRFFWPLPAGRYRLSFVREGRTVAVRDVVVPGGGRAARIRVVAGAPATE